MMHKLSRTFFAQDTNTVSNGLLGKVMHFYGQNLLILEIESYIGITDPACHASKVNTKRALVMFGPAGFTYVYLIYGMYNCLNVVTEALNMPAAVLIRGALLLEDLEDYNHPQDLSKLLLNKTALLNGPGKLCRYLNIDRSYNNLEIVDNDNFYFADYGYELRFLTTPRIGISKGKDKLWRYVIDYQHYLAT